MTGRELFAKENGEEITEKASRLPEYQKNTAGAYQTALKQEWEAADQAEWEERATKFDVAS